MHGQTQIKFTCVKQAKPIYEYNNKPSSQTTILQVPLTTIGAVNVMVHV